MILVVVSSRGQFAGAAFHTCQCAAQADLVVVFWGGDVPRAPCVRALCEAEQGCPFVLFSLLAVLFVSLIKIWRGKQQLAATV